MITYLFYFFLAYLLYQLVFKFILPIYRTTKQVKRGFRDMQERMNSHVNTHASEKPTDPSKTSSKKKAGDYIDFEEVRD
ncbi:MAG TPA: hypothetical protein VNA26_04925 [Chitinophagaceae bacterium]|nr:hypothetical protein [Chitinophagaceae bacterium]